MKLISISKGERFSQEAFTLPEIMVTMAVSILVIGGVLFSHITGLRMYELVKAKLGASDDTRESVSLLIDEIRSGKIIKVGNANSAGTFTEAADGTLQIGNALQIFPTTSPTAFIQYYLDAKTATLVRLKGNSSKVVASYVTNNIIFTSEDYKGSPLYESQRNRVIDVTLKFYQLQYPSTKIGSNQFYDSYQLKTKITRRILASQ